MQETLLHPSFSLSHIHTHPHTQCFCSACCVTVPWECWATFYPWLCPFFQSLYLTSLVLKGISQVRAPVSAKSLRLCQRFWPGVWEWTSGSLWASATACSRGIWVHVFFFFFPTASSRISEQVWDHCLRKLKNDCHRDKVALWGVRVNEWQSRV